jgi:DNA-binding NarL/FixJ family response regulator
MEPERLLRPLIRLRYTASIQKDWMDAVLDLVGGLPVSREDLVWGSFAGNRPPADWPLAHGNWILSSDHPLRGITLPAGVNLRSFIPLSSDTGRAAAAIRAVLNGWLALEPGTGPYSGGVYDPARHRRLNGLTVSPDGDEPIDGEASLSGESWTGQKALTRQELNVLEAIAGGKPNKAIATELAISESTVKFHLRSLFRKLGAQNRAQLISRAFSRGLLII